MRKRRFFEITLVLFISVMLVANFILLKRSIRRMVIFRIPGDYVDVGCGVLVSDVCIFNSLRDRTLERTVQRMIDYLHEKDPEKAKKILEEIKQNPIVSDEAIKWVLRYRKSLTIRRRSFLGKIRPIDYFRKKDVIIFAFWVEYCKESPFYGKFRDNKAAGGSVDIDPKTGKIIAFYL